jgi:hypothetical protein
MQRTFRTPPLTPSFRNGPIGLNDAFIGSDFTISPAYAGKTSWSLAADGPLNIGTTGEYTITAQRDVTVTAKMWGAGGARGWNYTQGISSTSNQGPGGGGGYTTATVVLRAGTSYVIQCGQGGARTTSTTPTNATYLAGGNGRSGGNGGAQGGGYSGIFRTSVSQANALIMAGGGGGGGDSAYSGSNTRAGGGSSGQGSLDSWQSQWGGPGTASAGGQAGFYNSPTAGAALQGGRGQTADTGASLSGGGGGYFGGGGGNVGGGGGGSGWVKTDADVSSGSTTTGNEDTPANSGDPDRNGAGRGGNATSNTGADGRVILSAV